MSDLHLASDLWDAFASEATPELVAAMPLAMLSQQIVELRADDCGGFSICDFRVAELIQQYARYLLGRESRLA